MAGAPAVVEDVLRCKKVIDAEASTTQEVLDHLRQLELVLVTKQVLSKTLIGHSVNKLSRKPICDAGVRHIAKQLVVKWKKAVGDAKGSPPATPSQKSTAEAVTPASTVGLGLTPAPDRFAEAEPKAEASQASQASQDFIPVEGSQGDLLGEKEKANSPGRPADFEEQRDLTTILDIPETGDAKRGKVIEKLFNALRPRTMPDEPEPMTLAAAIEEALWKELGQASPHDYTAQLRSLCYNLKDRANFTFRLKVMQGLEGYTPEKLPKLKAEQMASDAKKQERAQIRKEAAEMIQTDWDVRHGKAAVSGLFQCSKCKQWRTTYTQAQTRSADEPMTTFVTCVTCNNRWKFC